MQLKIKSCKKQKNVNSQCGRRVVSFQTVKMHDREPLARSKQAIAFILPVDARYLLREHREEEEDEFS